MTSLGLYVGIFFIQIVNLLAPVRKIFSTLILRKIIIKKMNKIALVLLGLTSIYWAQYLATISVRFQLLKKQARTRTCGNMDAV